MSACGTSGCGTFKRGTSAHSRAAESGLTAARVAHDSIVSPASPAPLDARVVLSAHLAGLVLAAASIVGFTVLMVLLFHWLMR